MVKESRNNRWKMVASEILSDPNLKQAKGNFLIPPNIFSLLFLPVSFTISVQKKNTQKRWLSQRRLVYLSWLGRGVKGKSGMNMTDL